MIRPRDTGWEDQEFVTPALRQTRRIGSLYLSVWCEPFGSADKKWCGAVLVTGLAHRKFPAPDSCVVWESWEKHEDVEAMKAATEDAAEEWVRRHQEIFTGKKKK